MSSRERPLLFSAPMVRALLDGSKTQTRRAVKDENANYIDAWSFDAARGEWEMGESHAGALASMGWIRCPYGVPGDRLWVRETWAPAPPIAPLLHHIGASPNPERKALYRANPEQANLGVAWKPSIHMPRWVSRITLEVTSVRVERLNAISEADARAEGVVKRASADGGNWTAYDEGRRADGSYKGCVYNARDSFMTLWESINGAGSWDLNPWVWAISFKRVTP